MTRSTRRRAKRTSRTWRRCDATRATSTKGCGSSSPPSLAPRRFGRQKSVTWREASVGHCSCAPHNTAHNVRYVKSQTKEDCRDGHPRFALARCCWLATVSRLIFDVQNHDSCPGDLALAFGIIIRLAGSYECFPTLPPVAASLSPRAREGLRQERASRPHAPHRCQLQRRH